MIQEGGIYSLPVHFDLTNSHIDDSAYAILPTRERSDSEMKAFTISEGRLISYRTGREKKFEISRTSGSETSSTVNVPTTDLPWSSRNVLLARGSQIILGPRQGFTGTIYVSNDLGKTFTPVKVDGDDKEGGEFKNKRLFGEKLYVINSRGLWRTK